MFVWDKFIVSKKFKINTRGKINGFFSKNSNITSKRSKNQLTSKNKVENPKIYHKKP
jgi:hypothetical protein